MARALVENRLAACVNIVAGAHSVYRWKGGVEEAAEFLLIIKTSRDRFAEVSAAIERLHSYELPEVIALPVVAGSARYLEWLGSALISDSDPAAIR
jgi:periplasmic divalent cation tolerance protein